MQDQGATIVDDLLERFPDGECDFVEEVAAPLPLQIICEMMGIPAERREADLRLDERHPRRRRPRVRRLVRGADDRGDGDVRVRPGARRGPPGQPHATTSTIAMMHAEVDGERLTAQEFGSFFILLVVAGNETTRNAISHGMQAAHRATPTSARSGWTTSTARRQDRGRGDRPLGHPGDPLPPHGHRGHRARRRRRSQAGDKVVLWYNSANRDERVFDRTRTASTCAARCSRSRSASAPAARTSASAPTSPAGRSR